MKNSITPLSEIMTASDVMEMLNICRTTLTRMQNRGDFPYYKFGARLVFYRRSEIMASITANRVEVAPSETTNQAA